MSAIDGGSKTSIGKETEVDVDKNEQRAVLLALLDTLDRNKSWCGETHVQKCAFFLQEGLRVPLGVEFVLYKHGPFSFGLRQALGEMRGDLLIETKLRPQPYPPSLAISESGRTFLQRHQATVVAHQEQITFVAEHLARRSVVDLERLGTALLVRLQDPAQDSDSRADRILTLKPHIKPQLAREAVDEVDQLLAVAERLRVEGHARTEELNCRY